MDMQHANQPPSQLSHIKKKTLPQTAGLDNPIVTPFTHAAGCPFSTLPHISRFSRDSYSYSRRFIILPENSPKRNDGQSHRLLFDDRVSQLTFIIQLFITLWCAWWVSRMNDKRVGGADRWCAFHSIDHLVRSTTQKKAAVLERKVCPKLDDAPQPNPLFICFRSFLWKKK